MLQYGQYDILSYWIVGKHVSIVTKQCCYMLNPRLLKKRSAFVISREEIKVSCRSVWIKETNLKYWPIHTAFIQLIRGQRFKCQWQKSTNNMNICMLIKKCLGISVLYREMRFFMYWYFHTPLIFREGSPYVYIMKNLNMFAPPPPSVPGAPESKTQAWSQSLKSTFNSPFTS